MKLRQAANTIFALTAVLPLLLFVYFMWRFHLLDTTEIQVGILLALVIALAGFVLFQRLSDRLAEIGRSLGQVQTPAQAAAAANIPGLGPVSEISEIAQAFGRMLAELRSSTERLEDLVFKLGALNDMVEMAARIPRVEDLLSHVLERTMRAVSASIGSIMLLDRERQTLRVAVGRGLGEDMRAGVEVKVGEGIAGRVVQAGEPVLVEDIESDPRFSRPNNPKYGGGSFICIPLRVGERVVGVVNLSKKESMPGTPSAFIQSDLQFLNALATYTAYAVDNARLFEEAQKAAQRLQDVVEDQKLRLTLAQQQMIQAAKLSALGELVAGVAHELNNPLTVLLGASDRLGHVVPESERQTYVRLIREATETAHRVVRGLLTFGRQMPLERRHVDLAELLEWVLDLSAGELRIEEVRIERNIAADLPSVWADTHQLRQVLLNLVTNAKQAMSEVEKERRLAVTMSRLGADRVRIEVADTGPGIAPDVLGKVFDPFVSTKGANGTGLGLSISYGIIREHGGTITAHSEPGRGASFVIELPVGSGAAASADTTPVRGGLEGKRLLIVEQDESVQSILLKHLEPAGCTAVAVSNPADARRHLGSGVDVIVAEFAVEGMDWLSLLGTSSALEERRRFVFLAASPVPDGTARVLREAGAVVLYKPFTGAQLVEAIRQALAG